VVDTGKDALHAALDEADAWLVWKDLQSQESEELSKDIKKTISSDAENNIDKIDALRAEVDTVTTQFELGVVFLKMIGKYSELLADVGRNSGMIHVYKIEKYADRIEIIEAKLRVELQQGNNQAATLKLNLVKADIEDARNDLAKAEAAYNQVVLPGRPLAKLSEGNGHIRNAKISLLTAHNNLNQAYLLSRGG